MAKLMESMKKYEVRQCFEGVMLLFAATSSMSIYTVLSVLGVADAYTSIVFKMTSILITLYIFIKTAYKYEKKRNDLYIALILILIPILCTMTIFSRGYLHEAYRGYYLGYFVCIPQAMLAGRLMADKGKTIPWGYSILVFAMISNIGMLRVLNSGVPPYYSIYGTNYQVLAYIGTYTFILLAFSIMKFHDLFHVEGNREKTYKLIILCSIVISVIAVVKGQGRGAQILFLITGIYFVFSFLKRNRMLSKRNVLLGIVALSLCTVLGIQYFNIGGVLLQGRLGETIYGLLQDPVGYFIANKRGKLIIAALQGFRKSPILGNGLGSIFYEVGEYSHNIFTDVFCEQGLIGFIVLISICFLVLRRYWTYRKDGRAQLAFLIMFAGFFLLLLSGYYLYHSEIWFGLGFIMTINDKGKRINE